MRELRCSRRRRFRPTCLLETPTNQRDECTSVVSVSRIRATSIVTAGDQLRALHNIIRRDSLMLRQPVVPAECCASGERASITTTHRPRIPVHLFNPHAPQDEEVPRLCCPLRHRLHQYNWRRRRPVLTLPPQGSFSPPLELGAAIDICTTTHRGRRLRRLHPQQHPDGLHVPRSLFGANPQRETDGARVMGMLCGVKSLLGVRMTPTRTAKLVWVLLLLFTHTRDDAHASATPGKASLQAVRQRRSSLW